MWLNHQRLDSSFEPGFHHHADILIYCSMALIYDSTMGMWRVFLPGKVVRLLGILDPGHKSRAGARRSQGDAAIRLI